MRRDEQKNENLLSNTPNCYVCAGGYFTGYAWQKYASGTDLAREQKYPSGTDLAREIVNRRRTRQTVFLWFWPSHHWRNWHNLCEIVMSVRADIYLRGMRDRSMLADGFGAGAEVCSRTDLAREIVNRRRTRQTVFLWFWPSHHWRNWHNLCHFWQREKSSFDRPNYTSIHVLHFKISVKKKRSRSFNLISRLHDARKPV